MRSVMKGRAAIRVALWAALSSCVCGERASAQAAPAAIGLPLMDQATEVQMALSAAPDYLRQGAGVYVLDRAGFRKVRESVNGYNCLVGRDVNSTAPICYDQEGSATSMEARLRYGQLMQEGRNEAEVDRLLEDDYRTGRLKAPRKPGVAYMLSSEFAAKDVKTGARRVIFPPHL